MELAGLNANRFARFHGGRMALDDGLWPTSVRLNELHRGFRLMKNDRH